MMLSWSNFVLLEFEGWYKDKKQEANDISIFM